MAKSPTHTVTIKVSSFENSPDVTMTVEWEPTLTEDTIEEQGYVPAAYKVAENFLFSLDTIVDPDSTLEYEEGDPGLNRTLN